MNISNKKKDVFNLADHLKCSWKITNKKYKNFTDLGNYVFYVGEIKNLNLDETLTNLQNCDEMGCSCVAKVTDNGDMIVGRNMDINVRQLPFFITSTSFGKYRTINITYMFTRPKTYQKIIDEGKIDEKYLNKIPFCCTDAFNEKGLYIEGNMRCGEKDICFKPLNPGKKPASWGAFIALACANCATVDEVVEYTKNSYDFFLQTKKGAEISGWNFAFIVADAKGNYGLIESNNGEVYFTPHQFGQTNYYLSKELESKNNYGCGYGRLARLQEKMKTVQNKEDMIEVMKNSYYSNGVLYPKCAYRDSNGKIHFVNDKGQEVYDWRSDYSHTLFVNDQGIAHAKPSDPNDPIKTKEEFDRCTTKWCLDDQNFESIRGGVIEQNINNVDDVKEFVKGNENPLRDNGSVWMTCLTLGINCTTKSFIAKFNENDKRVIEFKW